MSDRLTTDDIDQIVEGIEAFIIGGDDEMRDVWNVYLGKLEALKHSLAAPAASPGVERPDPRTAPPVVPQEPRKEN